MFFNTGYKLCNLAKMETVKNSFCFSCIDYSDDQTNP